MARFFDKAMNAAVISFADEEINYVFFAVNLPVLSSQ